MSLHWGVELVLLNEEGHEIDYLRVPFRSEQVSEFFKYCAPWFPLKAGRTAKLIVTKLSSMVSVEGALIRKDPMSIWVSYEGEQMRPRDAIRRMIGSLGGDDA